MGVGGGMGMDGGVTEVVKGRTRETRARRRELRHRDPKESVQKRCSNLK